MIDKAKGIYLYTYNHKLIFLVYRIYILGYNYCIKTVLKGIFLRHKLAI